MPIHPTAVVDPRAELGNVDIGPLAFVGPGVTLHDGVVLGPHAVVLGPTVVGARTRLHAHAVIGGEPQDQKHDGSDTTLVVGEGNVFREFTTAHRGSVGGRRATVIGDGNYFMANSHVAHDCVVGSNCMFANSVAIAGHVQVGDGAVLGGLAAVHQHARIGRLAMIGGGAMCAQDVPPFTLAQGDRARLFGLNVIGLRRAGIDAESLTMLKRAWRVVFASDQSVRAGMAAIRRELAHVAEVAELLAFIDSSERGVCRAAGR